MTRTAIPRYRNSIAKLGLDSKKDLYITIVFGYLLSQMIKYNLTYGLRDFISWAIAGAAWYFLIVPGMRSYRKRFPPKYPMHWFRSRVKLAPVLHVRPDKQVMPLEMDLP